MATYQFSLEPLLKHRQAIEDRAQQDLAKILRQRMILMHQLSSEQQTILESRRELADGLQGTVDMNRVGHFARYSGQVTQLAQTMAVRLGKLESDLNRAHACLAEAMRERKSVELLKRRRYKQWRRRQRRQETAELDEIALMAHQYRALEAVGS